MRGEGEGGEVRGGGEEEREGRGGDGEAGGICKLCQLSLLLF